MHAEYQDYLCTVRHSVHPVFMAKVIPFMLIGYMISNILVTFSMLELDQTFHQPNLH